jgi:putative membrane-bound dehydrogenase-like protein
MRMLRSALAIVLASCALSAQDGLPPKDGLNALTLPAGFSVQMVAAEPGITQPVAYCTDDRGRLWILENRNYPECPGKPENRIVILEDEKGDGTSWKSTVFVDNLTFATGIQVGFGGVWVGAPPNLLFIPDKDYDGKPDGAPQVVLDGWGWEDTHETLNDFTWGPDGWLYGTHGVFTNSKVGAPGTPADKRVRINAGVWRFHPTTKQFELYCEGASNQWGIDWNDQGQAFFTACVIPHLYHAIQGGRYRRQGGQHFNQYTYADLQEIAKFKYERAAYCGSLVYLGGLFPAEYRNTLFFNDIHMSKVRNETLTRQGSSFIDEKRPDFVVSSDSWFRTLSPQYGPDGSLYLNDWFDKVHCHQQRAETDRSNGRFYKISYTGVKPAKPDLLKASSAELVKLQLEPNEWYVRHARRILQERGLEQDGAKSAVRADLLKMLADNPDETRKLRALWALHCTKGLSEQVALDQLKSPAEYVRAWTIQLMCEDGKPSAAALAEFARLAKDDPSPVVRLYLASALQRIPLESRWDIAGALAAHEEDNGDHNLPLMIWYGIEPAVPGARKQALALAKVAKIARVKEFIAKRLGGAQSGDDE